MRMIDSDLLSIQEARILLEEALEAREKLKEQTKETVFSLEDRLMAYLKENIATLIKKQVEQTNYGKFEDEFLLADFYLKEYKNDIKKYVDVNDIFLDENLGTKSVAVSKGICLCFIAPFLSVLTTIQVLLLAVRSKNPVIFVPSKRCSAAVWALIDGVNEILAHDYYPKGGVSVLKHISEKGEYELYSHPEVRLIIENSLDKEKRSIENPYADIFEARIGNNIAFVDKNSDLEKASKEIVFAKAFNNGLLPGVEQSIVVDSEVLYKLHLMFEKQGAFFLSEEEHIRLQNVIYDENLNPRGELIGRSAKEIAKIANIKVNEDTKILVVTKPYVSKYSPYSKEKYFPILSIYIEDDWMHACEKCIELLLNDKKGHCLSIYSKDSYVLEQFIEKKPVAKLLINLSCGFGAIGLSSDLPISFMLSTRAVGGVGSTSLGLNHFMIFKGIGVEDLNSFNNYRSSLTK
ncbi:aldehyde dehydrogenase family protein [Peptoniphilaceae bacterium SGI.131]